MSTTQHWASAAIEIPQASPQRLTSAHESWVDVVRLLAAFLIVCIHSLKLDSRFGELPLGSPEWIAVDMLLAATRWALPIFVMISGYFLLDPRKSLDLHSYYHRRVQRLAWPLLAWTMLYLGISAYDAMLAGRPTSLAAMAIGVIKGAPYYHLWYLYMVPGLYLVAPFVKAATDHMSPGELIAAVATCFAFTILSAAIDGMSGLPSGSYITQFPRYLGYFLAGHLLGRVLPTPKLTAAVVMMVMAALAAATMAWIVAHQLSPARALRVFGFGNPAIIILSLAAFVLVRRLPIRAPWGTSLGPLADASLGIYLVHPAIIGVLQRWAQSNATPVLAIQATAVFVASLLIVLVMQRTPLLRRCV
jgi:surface polysaccharide O-acyltransferase-like enzyme